ncbi:MAG: hypothetical protein JNK38_00990 [Acidobacteria bacterium]|nr:hypothetical protein [Acidobacteriota bacterium]
MLVTLDPAIVAGCVLFETIADGSQIAVGKLFTVTRHVTAQAGDLVLALINGVLVVGRWFPNVAGCDWLLQAARIICCQRAKLKVLGRVLEWRTTAAVSIV